MKTNYLSKLINNHFDKINNLDKYHQYYQKYLNEINAIPSQNNNCSGDDLDTFKKYKVPDNICDKEKKIFHKESRKVHPDKHNNNGCDKYATAASKYLNTVYVEKCKT